MSAGVFLRTFYEASYDTTKIHRIRIQPEDVAATITGPGGTAVANALVTGPANAAGSAKITGSTRSLGLHARLVNLVLPSTSTPPTGYAVGSRTRIPCMSRAFFQACAQGGVVDYLGTQWEITGTRAEVVR
jgi:hypothetical protein